jgi:hypothetical protein
MMKQAIFATLLLAFSVMAQNETTAAVATVATPTCMSTDSDTTSYDACMLIQTTCTDLVSACETAGGSVEDTCIELATDAFTLSLEAVSFSDCDCDIACGSSMIMFSVLAMFVKFLL